MMKRTISVTTMNPAPSSTTPDTALWDELPGMAAVLAVNGRAVRVNHAFVQRLSAPSPILRGPAWTELLVRDSREALHAALALERDFSLLLQLADAPSGDPHPDWLSCTARWRPEASNYLCLLHDVSASRQAELSAREQAARFELLADNVPALMAYYDAATFKCQLSNSRYAEAFGWDRQSILGHTVAEVIGEAAARQIQPQVDTVLKQRRAAAYERQLPATDGSERWIEVNLLPHLDEHGEPVGCFVLISDITRHRRADQAVRDSEERLAKFMQASDEGIVFHRDGIITDANPPLCQLTGFALEDMLGRRTLDFIAPDHVARAAAVTASGQETAFESVLIDQLGQRIPVEFIVRTMMRNNERMRMTIVRDLRDRHAAQARIHHLAHHDTLTGLPNRYAFMEHIEQLMLAHAAAQQNGSAVVGDQMGERVAPVDGRLALLFIDLDHFKRINDSLGHQVGDTMLRTVAARITATLRNTDVVARFGGDEFMVLMTGVDQTSDVEEVAQKLLLAVQAPVDVEGRPLTVTPSIGIAMYPGDGGSPDDLIRHADTAMYLAKARGRAHYRFFDPSMASLAYAALVLEGELAQALERNEFELFFQPQVSADRSTLVGAEALIRWNHPVRGLLLPGEFLPVLEQQRLMLPIGQWVLRQAVRLAGRWQRQGLRVGAVAVNLSTLQFQSSDFVCSLDQALREEAVPGRLIELELTERMLMDDVAQVSARLREISTLGIRISVDDFGTGYSSLGHLKELPIDKFKIDRSFVHDLPSNRDSSAISRAIIQMGKSLGLTVMAEGVETEAQCEFLATHGCDEVQGLWISPPLSVNAFEAWVRQHAAAQRGE
jgi:diguanylate cyclase (GGDEF)-like protein/PAS domain S-box-containing protein